MPGIGENWRDRVFQALKGIGVTSWRDRVCLERIGVTGYVRPQASSVFLHISVYIKTYKWLQEVWEHSAGLSARPLAWDGLGGLWGIAFRVHFLLLFWISFWWVCGTISKPKTSPKVPQSRVNIGSIFGSVL
jgi:hypothetical protein